ncbi:cysteine desulfurase family protein [Parvularcula lutaonensis]|uniref:Cysteine desulfurase n=1 Tax=Parvularcula lutaonensis TaxID=491923 RepID=A0ABV7MC29_9PROT|nr:cysteine desulfurase family protein [Parvularcula lutaonensis]GGY49732.1 aminotransferase [Parvularcula lutaonensis]
MDRLYLDHNATSPLRPECRDAMLDAMSAPRNASSVHAEGRAAKQLVEKARKSIAGAISCPPTSIVFNSGGTEADHTAILGFARGGPKVRRLFLSATEHPAVPAAAEKSGLPVETVPVLKDGTLDLAWLEKRLGTYDPQADGPFLLCTMLANNETGVIHPVKEAAQIARKAGGYTMVDAVQALFKIEIDFSTLGADLLALSAHKAGGPVGIGALVVTPGLGFEPLLGGGGQEENRRAGTHNVPAIAGFGRLAEVASVSDYQALAGIRDRIEAGLPQGVTVHGQSAPRLPNTTCLTAPGFKSETQVMTMDLAGIAVSAGSACSSGKVKRSSVLGAMGVPEEEAATSLRISLGWDTPAHAAERVLTTWTTEFERISSRAA